MPPASAPARSRSARSPLRNRLLPLLLALLPGLAAPGAQAQDINAAADAVEPRVVEWRRHIHQHPELSFQEVKTAQYIAEALRAMPGIEVQTGLGGTGIKAVLKGGKRGPVVALRADMDALPVEEKNELPFRSLAKAPWQGKETPVMHACGHDTHVAMLLGAASILSSLRADLPGTVVFLFQPAEEWGSMGSPSGAFAMVAAGAMDNPKVDAVFGQHIGSGHPGGAISYRSGGTMASADGFTITVKGIGGHGAMPWLSKDPIATAAQIVTNLQSIVSRQVNLSEGAAVVTVGQFNAGNRINIIPEEATLAGTIRTLNEPTRTQVHEAVTRMAQKVAEASGLTADVKISRGYPVLNNDARLTASMVQALERAAGPGQVREIPPRLASEDFGAFAAAAPGFFWFLNASPHADRAGAPNHSPQFMVDEKYMKTGVKALVNVALEYLSAAAPPGGGKAARP
jgi:amidohydrolase